MMETMTGTVDTTRALASFLRTRREQLDPADLGLPASRRARRTPGLRREEVAELAGVSTDYIVRLEQGRSLRPSVEVLDALCRALRVGDDERAYVFDLARQRLPHRDKPATLAEPALAALIGDLSPLPAMLINHRYDILAWNREMALLMLDFEKIPPPRRNSLRLCVTEPALRDFYVDRERIIGEGIADLRAAWAAHPEDRELAELIAELTADSEEFARAWAGHDVMVRGRGRKPLRHPRFGRLDVVFEVLTPLQGPDQRVVIYRAADAASRAVLDHVVTDQATLEVTVG